MELNIKHTRLMQIKYAMQNGVFKQELTKIGSSPLGLLAGSKLILGTGIFFP